MSKKSLQNPAIYLLFIQFKGDPFVTEEILLKLARNVSND